MFKNLRTEMLVEKKYISRKSESQFRNRYILHTRNRKKESLIVGKRKVIVRKGVSARPPIPTPFLFSSSRS